MSINRFKEKKEISRRDFIQKSAVTTGMATLVPLGLTGEVFLDKPVTEKLPREIWIAGVSQMGLRAKTVEQMTDSVLDILKDIIPYHPDFVCLPEVFAFTYVDQVTTLKEKVELSDTVLKRFSAFSKQNNCYTICPVYTLNDGKTYNSAVVLNRSGERIGSYNKIHLPDNEIEIGLSSGQLVQPVIKTEFGNIGIQICFDIEWSDGWSMLRKQGAEIIFWPSAFAGGKKVNTKAWQNKCVVASATNKNTAKLCDISGEVIAQTGIWNQNLYCAPVNLEKVFLHTWPAVNRFREIQKKYGRDIRIINFHEEEWSVIESLSPEILVADIMKEFGLLSYEELIRNTEKLQDKSRL
jgi:predicted amidohydrolase